MTDLVVDSIKIPIITNDHKEQNIKITSYFLDSLQMCNVSKLVLITKIATYFQFRHFIRIEIYVRFVSRRRLGNLAVVPSKS